MKAPASASRILVIEDDRGWRALVLRLFGSREPGTDCLEAQDLASGLGLLGTPGLDLVLLDLNLPDCRGLETLRRVRKENAVAAVVIMTGETDEELALEALRSGAQDYLTKEKWDASAILRAARYARERMAVELRLRRSEALFHAISGNMVDLLAIVDVNGKRQFTSPSYARTLGFSMEELERLDMEAMVHPDDLPRLRKALADLFAKGASQSAEYRLFHKDGSCLFVEAQARRFESILGGGYQALVVARDVTARRRSEAERAHWEVQLRQAQKMESVGQLASGIAHEINSPIQYVNVNVGYLKKSYLKLMEVLKRYREASVDLEASARAGLLRAEEEADLPYLTEEVPKVLQETLDGVQRVAKIVRAMKEFTHPGIRERALLDVNRLVASAATIARNEWKYVAELNQDLAENLPPVLGFGAELNQVFINLIVNAAHAIAARKDQGGLGTITLTTRGVGKDVEIRVGDTGMGILPEHQVRIFEPFFTTKAVGQGTGQGLTICYQTVVHMHGGSIQFQTSPGEGTTFIILLPAAGEAGLAKATG